MSARNSFDLTRSPSRSRRLRYLYFASMVKHLDLVNICK